MAKTLPRQDAADTPKVFASKPPPLQRSMSQRGDDVLDDVMSAVDARGLKLVRCPRFDSWAPAHFDLSVLPIYVARAPRGSILAATHRGFALITRMAPSSRQLPSCVAVYPRDSRSRRVLCR